MLRQIKVLAGDFPKGSDSQFVGDKFYMKVVGKFLREEIPATQIAELEIVTEEYAKSFLGSAGLGLAAGWLLGPIGLAAGLLIGGLKKKVTFLLRFRDGRQFLGLTDEETYNLMATAFVLEAAAERLRPDNA
jgi:hypothetical protein